MVDEIEKKTDKYFFKRNRKDKIDYSSMKLDSLFKSCDKAIKKYLKEKEYKIDNNENLMSFT
jgi:hypothetical protein